MEETMRIFRWLSVAILASLALVSCAQGEKVTAQQIMDGLKQTREKTRDAHAVAEVNTSGTQQDGHFVLETWLRKTDKTDALGKPIAQSHLKVIEASKAELKGTEMVNNGETVWLYNPAQNKVITGKLQDLQQGKVGAQDPTAQMMRMQEQLQQLLDGSQVEIVAEHQTIAQRDAWQVKLTPKPETAQQMQIGSLIETNLWVTRDNDGRYIPLKAVINAGDLGKLEATVRQIVVDEGVDAQQFTFTVPAGAEVIDAAELAKQARPTTTNLDEARKSASFPVLSPSSLPAGAKLEEVQKLSMGGEAVIQNYGGAIEFSLVQTKGNGGFGERDAPFGAKTTPVTVRGQSGTLVSGSGQERGTLLRWQEHGVNIIIAGTLTPDQAQAIAASLK
jgi:outer membrane lipoprotein-sorting protein